MNTETLKAGIEAYSEERKMIEGFLRESKSQNEFDEEFGKYPTGRFRKEGLPGSGFIFGNFMTGYGHLSWWIDLLQHMVAAGDVVHTTIEGVQHYQTNASGHAPRGSEPAGSPENIEPLPEHKQTASSGSYEPTCSDSSFRRWASSKYEALYRPLESGLRILCQSPQLAPETYRYWLRSDDHNATDWTSEMRLQNALLKLHSELPNLLLDAEMHAETKEHVVVLRQVSYSCGTAPELAACTALQSHLGGLELDQDLGSMTSNDMNLKALATSSASKAISQACIQARVVS